MMRTSRPVTRRVSARSRTFLGAGALAVVLAGCGGMSPVTAIQPYEPSDGVSLDIADGQVALRNLLVVGRAKGEPAAVIGALVNRGAEPVTVALTADLAEETQPTETRVNVPARGSVILGPGERNEMKIPALPVIPGDVITIAAATATGGAHEVQVPVLPPEGPYASITVAPQPTQTPTPTATDDTAEPGTGSQGGPFPTEGATATPTGEANSETEPTATP